MKICTPKFLLISASLTGAVTLLAGSLFAANDWSLEDIMKQGLKGDTSLIKKVESGSATTEEKATLLAMFQAMPALEPPQGDADSWKSKCQALIDAMQAVVDGKDGSVDALKKASNCKSCHNVHKG